MFRNSRETNSDHIEFYFQIEEESKVNGIKRAAGWGGTLFLLLLISACGDVGGSGQCGGVQDSGSCVRVENIIPTYKGANSSNVDTVLNACTFDPVTGAPLTFEIFTDHSAIVTVTNVPLPGAPLDSPLPVTLLDYSISYSVNRCPAGATCPALTPLVASQSTLVLPNISTSFTLPFVPLSTKQEFVSLGGTVNSFPSYTATYVITGTNASKKPISIQGEAEFTIGNYDTCG